MEYEYLSALTEFDLNGKISGASPEGAVIEYRRWEILLHVVNHATDHRAQVLAMLHNHFGVNTVGQDMMAFLTEQNQ